ncbi:VOC family protein, partial [Bacillus cereus group sp. Bce025]
MVRSYTFTYKEIKTMTNNKLLRMDNVSIVVESLDHAISF